MSGDSLGLFLTGVLAFMTMALAVVPATRKAWRLLFRHGEEVGWVYLALTLLFASALVWSSSSEEVNTEAAEAGASNFVRLAFLGAGVLVTSIIAARYRFTFVGYAVTGVLGIFSLLASWNFVTAIWSVSPAVTIYKSFEYLAGIFLFASVLSMINARMSTRTYDNRLRLTKALFDWYWVLIFALLLAVYLGILVWPTKAFAPSIGVFDFKLQGAFPQVASNAVGDFAAIIGTVVVARLLCRSGFAGRGLASSSSRLVYALILAFALVTMILSQSRSPILGFLLAVIVVSVAARRYRIVLLAVVVLCAAFFSNYANVNQVTYDYMRRGQADSNVETLSGRTAYWEEALEATSERPLGGYGAYAGGRYVLERIDDSGVSSLHNTYMEALVGSGAVGLTILVVGLVATLLGLFGVRFRAASHPISWSLWVESLGVLTVMLLRSVFSVPFIWTHIPTLGLILVLITVLRSNAKRPVKKGRHAHTVDAQPLPAAWR